MNENSHDKNATEDEYAEFWKHFNARHDDPLVKDIKKTYRWFVDVMGEEKWSERRDNVLRYFRSLTERLYSSQSDVSFHEKDSRMAFYDDWIAWYLYLAESLADRPTVDEPAQSSRIWPFFATIGEFSEELKRTKGIENKLKDLLIKPENQPDSVLFELVVAACYIKNGWEVEFIPESGAGKTPDLLVTKGNDKLYVECKRLAKVTQYSENERTEWVKRWQQALPYIISYPYPVFFNVKFKCEINSTNQDIFLNVVRYLYASRDLMQSGVASCENDEISVVANLIDMDRINEHFAKWIVKYPSPQLNSLLDDNYDPHGSYTMACQAKLCTYSDDEYSTINVFADEIKKPFCAKWECIADESITKKAKDVKGLLVKAVRQAPDNGKTVIHIGYETLHGPHVEVLRDEKITNMLANFDCEGKDIEIVYCHSFQPRLFSDNNWDFAETVRYYLRGISNKYLLKRMMLLEREGIVESNDTHWEQDLREMNNK
ncbi:hypothetical protein QI624_003342 [Salmonella enterica]|nr:hypothetical protein [Salmonella enterica]